MVRHGWLVLLVNRLLSGVVIMRVPRWTFEDDLHLVTERHLGKSVDSYYKYDLGLGCPRVAHSLEKIYPFPFTLSAATNEHTRDFCNRSTTSIFTITRASSLFSLSDQ